MQNEQLDRLAAEKVMGWRLAVHQWIGEWGEVEDTLSNWSPTTNEANAALVREKMRADGWILRLYAHPRFHEAEWVFEADRIRIGQSRLGTPSVAFAITQAALLAVEAITEEEVNA